MLVAVVAPACARSGSGTSSEETNGDGQKAAREQSGTAHRGSTVQQSQRQVLTGVITDEGEGSYLSRKGPGSWMLVEEDPEADCGGDRGPRGPGCDKMYFDITAETEVFSQEGDAREVPASVADLEKGTRVSADYAGHDVAESYPSKTDAREVKILGSSLSLQGGRAGKT